MSLRRKIVTLLGIKGILAVGALSVIAFALVIYTASVLMTPTQQFNIGATSDSWVVYVNDLNKIRYLPGGVAEPAFSASDPNTYAFKVVTDANQVCAVKIELTTAMNTSKFSNFNITVKYWNGAAWTDETLYNAATGSTPKSYIDGLASGDAGYVHLDVSTTRYYLIKATYSYDKVDETAQITTTFQYTPLPQNSF